MCIAFQRVLSCFEEHDDMSLRQPELARVLYARLEAYSATMWDPLRGDLDYEGACAAVVNYGGFLGPWLEDGHRIV